MASVSSLDQDMRRLRMDRYTSSAASEARIWIENTLRESLPAGDLLDALKDGVALCKLANMVLPPPGLKFKVSSMPFTQRENISMFLTACERAPLSLPAHDRFLTVDLYDNKDPAQVLQCLGAFSRAANASNPTKFPQVIGPRRSGAPSPTRKTEIENPSQSNRDWGVGDANAASEATYNGARALSPTFSDGSAKRSGTISSWSNRSDEATSAPAWNIHQYGYMGGASQGNQGISFGARRQIISPDINVPSLAEKEKRRKEAEIEAERQKLNAEQEERERRQAQEADEQRARLNEEDKWAEETRKARERERKEAEAERRRWEEEEKRWKLEEEARRREEEADNAGPALKGQYLSQYQSDQRKVSGLSDQKQDAESERIRELERQLEEAKERERQYLLEREAKRDEERTPEPDTPQDTYRRPTSFTPDQTLDSFSTENEQEESQLARGDSQTPSTPSRSAPQSKPLGSFRPLSSSNDAASSSPSTRSPFTRPGGPLSAPQAEPQPALPPVSASAEPPRPLPDPSKYSSPKTSEPTRTDRFLATNPAPPSSQPRSYFPTEMGLSSTSEKAAEDNRRAASQAKTKAGGWASKSLLEREMEMERERQREWEKAQLEKAQYQGATATGGPASSGRLMGPREMR